MHPVRSCVSASCVTGRTDLTRFDGVAVSPVHAAAACQEWVQLPETTGQVKQIANATAAASSRDSGCRISQRLMMISS